MFTNGSTGRVINSMFLIAVAAGCGWLLYTQARKSPAVADGARNLARTLRDRIDDVSELTADASDRLRASTRKVAKNAASRISARKNSGGEPMAGYGA